MQTFQAAEETLVSLAFKLVSPGEYHTVSNKPFLYFNINSYMCMSKVPYSRVYERW